LAIAAATPECEFLPYLIKEPPEEKSEKKPGKEKSKKKILRRCF
jgi:hypothetical protein